MALYAVQQNFHLTIPCLSLYFGTILTIFAKSKYYFDVDKSSITLQHSRNKELCLFSPSSLNKYRLHIFVVRNLIHVACKVFSCFYLPKFDFLLFFPIERNLSATFNWYKLNELFLLFFFMFEKFVSLELGSDVKQKSYYDSAHICPIRGRKFNSRTFWKFFYFVICMISRHWFQTKLLRNKA